MKRFSYLFAVSVCVILSFDVRGQDTHFEAQGDQIPGPANNDAAAQKAWLADLRQWRKERLIRAGFDDSQYRRPEFQWIQKNFVSPQAMVEDRYFYDPVARRYTVNRFLDDLDKRYGGIDSVLLWPVYPNIGIDNRSQWDLTRDMPGGVAALRKVVEEFHRRGVKVLFPAMPWDTGTRDPGMTHAEATAKLMAEIGADGVNGDTFEGVPRTYRTASDETGHPVAFEPEITPRSDEQLIWNNMNWAYWKFPFAPMVAKAKWLETRHMEHISDRWGRDKTDDLQYAFFNGLGFVSWENVWGWWNGMTPRDAEALRRVAKIERFFADALASPDWEPYYPMDQAGVFSSMFPGKRGRIWTIVNRNEYAVSGMPFGVDKGDLVHRYLDIWNGVELAKPLRLNIEPHGFAAVLEMQGAIDPLLGQLMGEMSGLSAKPLMNYSNEWKVLPQKIVEIPSVRGSHAGMVSIPGGKFHFVVKGVEIEGDNRIGTDVQYPWEDAPRRGHEQNLEIKPFFMDKYPVTNSEFKAFLEATHYSPEDQHNFLKDWMNGSYPDGWANRPVTWVSLEDARAYSKWAGKRLPHEWEWQYVAQGGDSTRLYPWGSTWDDKAVVPPVHKRDLPGPEKVGEHDQWGSPFGVMDLVGNVWQWTDEYVDEHTRAAIVRGGSYYRPAGSMWYFPQNTKLNEHGKYLLMAPSKDRAGTLGFRCVVDGE